MSCGDGACCADAPAAHADASQPRSCSVRRQPEPEWPTAKCLPLAIVVQVPACCKPQLSNNKRLFPDCRLRPSRSCLPAAFPPCSLACAARSPNGRLFLPPSLIQAAPFLPLLPRWAPPLRMLPLTSPPLTRVVTHCPCQSAYALLRNLQRLRIIFELQVPI